MFKKNIPIIFVGLSAVVAVLVLGWSVFVKTEVPVLPITSDEIVNDSSDVNDNIIDDNNDSEIDISDWEDGNVLEVNTSDWKVYRNEIYGYEIKYPQSWILETYDGKYGKGVKKLQEEADWIDLTFRTKDRQKIENYQESLMASVNITVINKSSDFTVEDYLKDFGYDLNSETVKDGRVLRIWGLSKITKTWMNIKKENFKGHKTYIIQPMKEHGYYMYFYYNQNIYKITSLWHRDEISEQKILEIINTFEFTK